MVDLGHIPLWIDSHGHYIILAVVDTLKEWFSDSYSSLRFLGCRIEPVYVRFWDGETQLGATPLTAINNRM
jgi:hypothetical protein